jgi:CRP-like cAMP-binding protein
MPSRNYDPAAARAFFESAGKRETVPAGARFFSKDEKSNRILLQRDKMYLLLDGEVALASGDRVIGTVSGGEIFGEMAAIARLPRTATAIAKTACTVVGLDDKQFRNALARQPSFALALMSFMIGRLRDTIARLREANSLEQAEVLEESAAIDPKRLTELASRLSDDPPVYFDRRKSILQEGQAGMRMYAVLDGTVVVSIDGAVVERLGPGGVFGELALIEQAPRLASVTAETDCSLLPINRAAFLALVESSPEFAASLLNALAERLRRLTSRLQ